jgi:3-oxoacyl-[acyl-carrier protein] reductase
MTRELSDAIKDTLLSSIPLNRLGKGKEIAHAVAFLASAGAGYITGETIHVNGGMFMP